MQYAFSDVTSLTVSPSPLLCLSTLLFQYAGFRGVFGFLVFRVFGGFQKQRERMDTMNKEQDDSKIENGGVFHFCFTVSR